MQRASRREAEHTESRAAPRRSRRPLPKTRSALLRIGGLAVVLAATVVAAYRFGWLDYRHTLAFIARLHRSHGAGVFTLGYVLVYGIGGSMGMPALPFTVAAGVLFGTVLGSVLAWLGAMVGAALGYWTAGSIARDVVLRWVRRYRRADAAVAESRDFDGMLRLRLLPVIPLGVVNFVGGLARVPFGSYMAATAVGVIPATIIYAYFSDSLVEGVDSGRTRALVSLAVSSTLLILLSLAPRLARRMARRRVAGAPPENAAAETFAASAASAISDRSAPTDSLRSPRSRGGDEPSPP